jgi:hypothetical protein
MNPITCGTVRFPWMNRISAEESDAQPLTFGPALVSCPSIRMANFSHARIVIFCGLCFLSSCDKPARLKAEQEELTAQAAAMKKELTELDAKLKAVGSGASNYIAALERQAQEAVAKAEADELAVSSKVQKLARIEASVKELRSKVDAWKAKYRK